MEDTSAEDRLYLEAIGRRLRRRRQELGLNVVEIAEHSGVSHSYISRLERGLIPGPKLHELRGVARGYQLRSVCDLLEGADGTAEDTAVRALVQHPDLGERVTALATAWEWASGEVRTFALATLDMLAGQLAAAQRDGVHGDRPGE